MKCLLTLIATTFITAQAFANHDSHYNAKTVGQELLDNIADIPVQRMDELGCNNETYHNDNYDDEICEYEASRKTRSHQYSSDYDGDLEYTKDVISNEIHLRKRHYNHLGCNDSHYNHRRCHYERTVLDELSHIFLIEINYAINFYLNNIFRSYTYYAPIYRSNYYYGENNYNYRRHHYHRHKSSNQYRRQRRYRNYKRHSGRYGQPRINYNPRRNNNYRQQNNRYGQRRHNYGQRPNYRHGQPRNNGYGNRGNSYNNNRYNNRHGRSRNYGSRRGTVRRHRR